MSDDNTEHVQPEEEREPTPTEESASEKEQAPDWLLDNIAELSKNTRSIYLLYLGFLTYCAVTVVGTSDRQMLLDESVRLPLVGVDVSLTGFFVMAPVVAICTFVYLQLYLQELQVLKTTLHVDYKPVDAGRLYPWMVNVIDYPRFGVVGWLQRAAVNGVMWWMLPGVLFLFALWYLKAQDLGWGWIVELIPTIGLIASLYFWHEYRDNECSFREDVRNGWAKLSMLGGGTVLQLAVLLTFILTASGWWPQFGWGLANIDVSHQSLITEKKYATYWVDLNSKRLNGANLTATILLNADLREARLQDAVLWDARLDSADLSVARLQGAELWDARLQGANLSGARLQGAELLGARLDSAEIRLANLQGAFLWGASLQGADLSGARLQGASLSAKFVGARLLGAARLQGADLWRARLQGANLSGARLQGADLRDARLQGAIIAAPTFDSIHVTQFHKSSLQNATLDSLICLLDTFNLCSHHPNIMSRIVDELCKATTLEGMSADAELLGRVRRKCSHLLGDSSE